MAIPLAPAGPIPYAPQALSPAPEMGMNIAQMMLQNANQQYQNKSPMFGQLGQGIAGVGQAIVQGQREDRLSKQAELDNQIKAAQLFCHPSCLGAK